MIKREFTAIITKGEVAYVSYSPELGIASQGKTVVEAKKNLAEAIELYLEEAGNSNVLKTKVPVITTIKVQKKRQSA
ncbi:Uncharacterised protein [Candidatus Gugararchaeum adminiculabundum]|nr:Uncharacterised protein [Candidatus Gugararchaeum adminiculabundum]